MWGELGPVAPQPTPGPSFLICKQGTGPLCCRRLVERVQGLTLNKAPRAAAGGEDALSMAVLFPHAGSPGVVGSLRV